ncbi:MAG TPA: VOC family protein [Algoriphagus sp.]|nr:VOC family protein [Algoriphagus sp.]
MKKPIYPSIWFEDKANEAAEFYVSVFPDSKILESNPMVTTWSSSGQKFMLLNGGGIFKPNPSISFYTVLDSKEELKEIWDKLIQNGKALMPLDSYPWSSYYGWLEDHYGVSWQLTIDKPEGIIDRFSPALMFTGSQFGNAERAINYYLSIFEHASLRFISRYGEDQGSQAGKINHAQFMLNGHLFIAMDSNLDHQFSFSEGISFVVECEDQAEIDFFWEKLTKGGEESQCGWLKDQFGVSWQIVPAILNKLMADPDRSERVIQAFLKMKKFDIEALLEA